MEINYSQFIRELSLRSKANYEYIKQQSESEKEPLYEVIQLINSMYCMLVVPEEIFGIRHLSEMKKEDALKTQFSTREKNLAKYPVYHEIKNMLVNLRENNRMKYITIDEYTEDYPVCAFINSIRNALCHDGVGFLPIQTDFGGTVKNKITDVIFETKNPNNDSVTFIAIISVDQLEDLLMKVSELYCLVEQGKEGSNAATYREFFEKLEKDVKKYLQNYC